MEQKTSCSDGACSVDYFDASRADKARKEFFEARKECEKESDAT